MPSVKRPRHRPSSYSQAVAQRVLDHFAEGGTRHELDADKALPAWTTFKRWMSKHPDLRSQYARAREEQREAYMDEIVTRGRNTTPETANADRVAIDALKYAEMLRRPKADVVETAAEDKAAQLREFLAKLDEGEHGELG